MPRTGINAMGHGHRPALAQRSRQPPRARIGRRNGIMLAGDEINRQVPRRNGNPAPSASRRSIQSWTVGRNPQTRIGGVSIDRILVAREPVERRARRREAAIVSAEGQRMEQAAAAPAPDAPPSIRARSAPARASARGWQITARQHKPRIAVAAFPPRPAARETSPSSGPEESPELRLLGGDVAPHRVDVLDARAPTVRVGEISEVLRGRRVRPCPR